MYPCAPSRPQDNRATRVRFPIELRVFDVCCPSAMIFASDPGQARRAPLVDIARISDRFLGLCSAFDRAPAQSSFLLGAEQYNRRFPHAFGLICKGFPRQFSIAVLGVAFRPVFCFMMPAHTDETGAFVGTQLAIVSRLAVSPAQFSMLARNHKFVRSGQRSRYLSAFGGLGHCQTPFATCATPSTLRTGPSYPLRSRLPVEITRQRRFVPVQEIQSATSSRKKS